MASSSRCKPSSSSTPLHLNSLLPLPPPTPLNTPNPNPNSNPTTSHKRKSHISPQQHTLSNSTHLTREQLLKRRSKYLKELADCYKDHLWFLMEDVRAQFTDYTWKFGLSPFEEDRGNDQKESNNKEIDVDGGGGGVEGSGETLVENNGGVKLCAFNGCKFKAMVLTCYCHLHILSDPKQQLYKPCDYVIKSSLAGDITCGKPILRSTVPSLCNTHKQKAQNHLNRALKKAGLNINSSDTVAPKLNVLVAEFVREIQTKRRAIVKANRKKGIANKSRD